MQSSLLLLVISAAACHGWNYMQDIKMWDPSICCYPIPPGCCPECLECIDIALIIDESGSISDPQLANMKNVLLSFISDSRLPAHPDLQTALVKFGRTSTLEWNWGVVTDELTYIANVNGLTLDGRFTQPVTGMDEVKDNVIGSAGDRAECPNACVIITDGLAQNSLAELTAGAADLRAACDSFLVVGVTISVPPAGVANFNAQLLAMAGGDESNKFTTDDFSGLGDVFSDIIDDWCEELGGGSSNEKCCPYDYIYMVTKKPKHYGW